MAVDGAQQLPSLPSPEDEKLNRRKKNIENLEPGSLMKAIVRSGDEHSSNGNPKDGDLVIIHCAIRTLDGTLVHSTRSEHGGILLLFSSLVLL